MEMLLELSRLQQQAEQSMKDAESLGESEWAASYRGQAYAYAQAAAVVRQFMKYVFILELQPEVFFVSVSKSKIPHWTSHMSRCFRFASEAEAEEHRDMYARHFPAARVIGIAQ